MRAVFLSSLVCLAVLPVLGAERTLTIDPAATKIDFLLEATGHVVRGSFPRVGGDLRFDAETGEARGEIRVNSAGAQTGNRRRDRKMHEKVLESEKYPLFVFHPEQIEGDLVDGAGSSIVLVGTISIHGADHPLQIPAEVQLAGNRVTVTARFSIPYVDWGMKDPSVLFLRVAKEVQVTVRVEGRLVEVPSAGSNAKAR